MSRSHEDSSASERNLQETHDELTQASIALNTAYDRLQDLHASLRNFTAQRDRPSSIRRTHQQAIPQSEDLMRPSHSAIVLSDSEEENEVDFDTLRESLPSWVLELNSRWVHQRARLNAAARRVVAVESSNAPSASSPATLMTEESRSIYPPFRRRRALPATGSLSRDVAISAPIAASPARRSILEAHLRQVRRASSPGESSTTLGRRVSQRVAAAEAATGRRHTPSTVAPSDTVVRSSLPLGLEPRSSPSSPSSPGISSTNSRIESRAAAHLRHSLLPNPPSGIRSAGVRTSSTNGTFTRFNERAEHRPRPARSNSLTALTRSTSAGPGLAQQVNTLEPSVQAPPPPAPPRGLRASHPASWEEDAMRFNFSDPLHTTYRVRRRINSQGEEQVFNINWSELVSDGERDEDLSDPAAWMRPPRRSLPSGSRPPHAQVVTNMDEAIVHNTPPAPSHETRSSGQEGSGRRRRGWARLDADGDEISTEDEASLEQVRTDLRLPRTRNWARNGAPWAGGRESTVAVLDFVHHNSRDATTGHRDPNEPLEGAGYEIAPAQNERNLNNILDGIFHLKDSAYINPLPVHFSDKRPRVSQHPLEVRVTVDPRIAGR